MNVALTPEVTQFIEQMVKAGFYKTPEKAVNTLLSNVADPGELTPDDTEELRAAVDIGIAEADRGEFVEFSVDDVIAEGQALLAARREGA